ncbi:fimbrial protein [Shewanella mangrovisoli]|uniref:fimbrial protein n=1 Tax=Shewanella mangrovisoli TaxID=2864211 RepID=UPI0035B9FF3B
MTIQIRKEVIYRYIKWSILILSILLHSKFTYAAYDCRVATEYNGYTYTPIVNVSESYVGNDQPIGSVLYQFKTTTSRKVGVICPAYFSVKSTVSIDDSKGKSPITMATSIGVGAVYPTDVQGIGVMYYVYNSQKGGELVILSNDKTPNFWDYTNADGGTLTTYNPTVFRIALIKTGPIASNSVVNMNSLPTVIWELLDNVVTPLKLYRIKPAGSITFISNTCTVLDRQVNLGQYEISNTFQGMGSTTPWIDSSITLQNCPTFSGYYGTESQEQLSADGATASGGTLTPNLLSVTISPTSTVTDSIISLENSSLTATGIGLQLGYTPDNFNADPLNPAKIWNEGDSWSFVFPSDGTSTFRIPLAARYYQNSQTVNAGKADAKIVVNIEYK